MAEADSNEKESPKSPIIKILLLVVLVVILAGGGLVGWKLLQTKTGADATEGAQEPAVVYSEASAPVTYTLNTFIVNLMGKSGMSQKYLKVGVMLGIGAPTQSTLIDQYKPLLNDSALILLSSKTYGELATVEGKIQLKQELINRMNQILGGAVVRKVYFTEFVVQ